MKEGNSPGNVEETASLMENRAALEKLIQDASNFETLSNRPLAITYLDTSEVVYASSLIDRYLGFSHLQYKKEGAAYIARYFGHGQKDWMMQVNVWRKEFHDAILAEPDSYPSPFYTYDVQVNSPATGFLHKLVVRTTCLNLQDKTRFLATTFFDVSALKRSKKLFFHAQSSSFSNTFYKDMELESIRKETPMLTEPEAELVRLLRVVSPEIAAQQLHLQPGTIQARLKSLCRKTDSIGLHGLVQVCDAMGWC